MTLSSSRLGANDVLALSAHTAAHVGVRKRAFGFAGDGDEEEADQIDCVTHMPTQGHSFRFVPSRGFASRVEVSSGFVCACVSTCNCAFACAGQSGLLRTCMDDGAPSLSCKSVGRLLVGRLFVGRLLVFSYGQCLCVHVRAFVRVRVLCLVHACARTLLPVCAFL